eukprot:c17625_g1_i1.p1 GENE.c17625_g1_i1~~c17625_g1_i1.p1  ORF type:complete len:199 (-),score=48.53 c17625_g1_i1:11-607(-)
MRLNIKLYTGERFSIEMTGTETIEIVKEKIAEAKNFTVGDLRLAFSASDSRRSLEARSRELENNSTLNDNEIRDGDELDLLVVPGIKFCKECNNMLHPKQNKMEKKLYFFCRHCQRKEATDMHCIYRNEVRRAKNEKTAELGDIINDPTLLRAQLPCTRCAHPEAVLFQSSTRNEDRAMVFYYVCCNPSCLHRWQIRE